MKDGTLADAVLRQSYRKKSIIPAGYRDTLIRARKFVLDEGMSAHLADLTNAPFTKNMAAFDNLTDEDTIILATKDARAAQINIDLAEGARRMARLPHPVTWIEYNCRARRRRSIAEYPSTQMQTSGSFVSEDEVMPRVGWLLEQHPAIQSAIRMTTFCDMMDGEAAALPFSYTWVADDRDQLPWASIPFDTSGDGRHAAEIATGMLGHDNPHVGIAPPPHQKGPLPSKVIVGVLLEMIGELRCAWTFLATVNDLPVVFDQVKPQRGYIGKGQYRRFVEHSVVRLTVPAHRYRAIAMRALAAMRRRAHEVRGHWRNDWRHPRAPGCDHIWLNKGESILECQHCTGRRIWIVPHQRGDASLGFVNHEYSVERGVA